MELGGLEEGVPTGTPEIEAYTWSPDLKPSLSVDLGGCGGGGALYKKNHNLLAQNNKLSMGCLKHIIGQVSQ